MPLVPCSNEFRRKAKLAGKNVHGCTFLPCLRLEFCGALYLYCLFQKAYGTASLFCGGYTPNCLMRLPESPVFVLFKKK